MSEGCRIFADENGVATNHDQPMRRHEPPMLRSNPCFVERLSSPDIHCETRCTNPITWRGEDGVGTQTLPNLSYCR